LPRRCDLFVQGPRTADRSEGGRGIGLTLVRSLVQMHGGTVVALSDGPGKGSAFVVRLPAATTETSDDAPAPTAPKLAQATRSRRVLVVDDNVDAASLLAELCQMMGHEVKVAHDGPQALTTLESFAPEIAVLDIGLPVMDGYTLGRELRTRMGAQTPILIALTGYGQDEDRRRSETAGFRLHLVKPVDAENLTVLVDTLVGKT
jgi:CheY-like chemotaxis protein